MAESESESSVLQQIESLSIAMQEAKETGDRKKYNDLASQYNELILKLENSLDSIQTIQTIQTIQCTDSIQSSQSHSGIRNTLSGIVSNCRKGKYSESDKQQFIRFLQETIAALQEIDCDAAMAERKRRQAIYSGISSRL